MAGLIFRGVRTAAEAAAFRAKLRERYGMTTPDDRLQPDSLDDSDALQRAESEGWHIAE